MATFSVMYKRWSDEFGEELAAVEVNADDLIDLSVALNNRGIDERQILTIRKD